jgi:hypothetical protein
MSSFSIIVMEEPCCFVFGKRGKNILQDGDFFQYSKNYTKKEKSYWKCVISTCKGRAITSGDFIVEKIHHDLRREDTLAKLLFKELKDKTYIDPKAAQSARFLERNTRFKIIVNSVDVSNSNYLIQIINN